jgi:hypothetical protein
VAAWNQVLCYLEHPNQSDDHKKDSNPVFGVTKAETRSNYREGYKSFQSGGCVNGGPKLNRGKSGDGYSQDKQPCSPPEE